MAKTIFFDFFGVISSEVAPFWFARHFDEEKAKIVKEQICSKADNGDLTEEQAFFEISKVTGVEPNIVKKEWLDLVHINLELKDYILSLRKKYNVYLLSNALSSFLNPILDENDLRKLFNRTFISSDIHKIKPHTEYFQYVLDTLNLKASDCVMIDDNSINIQGAIDTGIHGIVYKNNLQLKKELDEFLNL